MSNTHLARQENRVIYQIVYRLFKESEWRENQLQCFLDNLPYEKRKSRTIIEAILAHKYGKAIILPADDIELTNWRFLIYVLLYPTTQEEWEGDLVRNYTKESLQHVKLDPVCTNTLLELLQTPAHRMAWRYFERGDRKPKVPTERPLPPMQSVQDLLH